MISAFYVELATEQCESAAPLTSQLIRQLSVEHTDITRMAGNPLQPSANGRIGRQIKAAFIRHMGVGVQGDIGNREILANQIRRALQLLLHHLECLVTAHMALFVLTTARFRQALIQLDKACHRDIRLVAVLLEKLPLQQDRKSTRLNSSHSSISYAVFCLKKKS